VTEIEGDATVLANADDSPNDQCLVCDDEDERKGQARPERDEGSDPDAHATHEREGREDDVQGKGGTDRRRDAAGETGEETIAGREHPHASLGEPQR
jgi:hypothetical protein